MTYPAHDTGSVLILMTRLRVRALCCYLAIVFTLASGAGAIDGAQADSPASGSQSQTPEARLAELIIPSTLGDGVPVRLWNSASNSEREGASGMRFLKTLDQAVRLSVTAVPHGEKGQPPVQQKRAELKALRWLEINIRSKRNAQGARVSSRQSLASVNLCSRAEETSCISAVDVAGLLPRVTQQADSSILLQPENADRKLEMTLDAESCQDSAETCTVRMASWRLARELSGHHLFGVSGQAGLPDLLWVVPDANGLISLYGARNASSLEDAARPWAVLRLPDEMTESLGFSVGGRPVIESINVPAPLVLVLRFRGGFVSLDFAEDTCRVVTAEAVWACQGGLGSHAAIAWLRGQVPRLIWDLPLFLVQKVPSHPMAARNSSEEEPSRVLSLDTRTAVFTHALVQFTSPDSPGLVSWVDDEPLALAWSGSSSGANVIGLPWRVFDHQSESAELSSEGEAHWALAYATPSASVSSSASVYQGVKILKGTLKGLQASQVLPAADGIYTLGTSGQIFYVGSSGVQNTSVQKSNDVLSFGPRDLLMRRDSGVNCQYVHLQAHARFPVSLSETGLSLPCGRAVRASLGPSGLTSAVLVERSSKWLIRWLE